MRQAFVNRAAIAWEQHRLVSEHFRLDRLVLHLWVDQRRAAEPLTAVDDAVTDCVNAGQTPDQRLELSSFGAGLKRVEVVFGEDLVARSEQSSLRLLDPALTTRIRNPRLRRPSGLGFRRCLTRGV